MPERSSLIAILDRAASLRRDLSVLTRLIIQQAESLPDARAIESLHYLLDSLDQCHIAELEDLERAIVALVIPPAVDPLDVPFDQLTASEWEALKSADRSDASAA